MGAIREFQKRERENWESYFESSPAQARVVHYAKALCLRAKLKILSAKYATIAHALNVSESSVIRSLNKACSLGILKKVSQGFKKRRAFYWVGDVAQHRLANDEVRESLGIPALFFSPPLLQQKTLQKPVYNYSIRSHNMKSENQNPSFEDLQKERVFLEYDAIKNQLLESRYQKEDIERFFLQEIESRRVRKALGFLDPWRRASNDWDILVKKFKRLFYPAQKPHKTLNIQYPWENIKEEEKVTPQELKDIWQDFYRKKGRPLE